MEEVGCEQQLEAALSKVRAAVRDGNLARKGCLGEPNSGA